MLLRLLSTNKRISVRNASIGILRETKDRWECRAPLTPENVKKLNIEWKNDLEFYVQPSKKRIYSDEQYKQSGAKVQNDLSNCDLLMGIKEVKVSELIQSKSYIFFSHTHKGQAQNLNILTKICESGITLFDYELIKDNQNNRLVAFGSFAGSSGMINILHGLGDRLLSRGIRSPFLYVPMTQYHKNLDHVKESMKIISNEIKTNGICKEINPIVFTFTGSGNVSKGAQEIFKLLPHEWIDAKDLKQFCMQAKKEIKNDRVYGCVVEAKDYIKLKSDNGGSIFEYNDYLINPHLYESIFHEKIAPYSTVIINGIYWEKKYPRLITKEQMKELQLNNQSSMLISIADITCDLEGSIEFMNKASTVDDPFYYYDAVDDFYSNLHDAVGVQIMSIDNLPTQLPEDSSIYFGKQLEPLIPALVGLKKNDIIEKSKITDRGKFVEKYSSLNNLLLKQQKILILGSGYVVPPVVDFFSNYPDISLIIATNTPEEARNNFKKYENCTIIGIDVITETEKLENLIKESDLVISLITANLHVPIAESCIRNKKSLVTASYISDDMQKLNSAAESANVLLLNEIGFDPGLDHLAAMEIIDTCKNNGELIESFVSWCGGLPAPEIAADNCFGYKFSWSPRGVLLATQNPAQYLQNNQLITIPGDKLLESVREVNDVHPVMMFKGIPNRDSMKYIKLYGLDNISTMFRGTLRYKGFCELMSSFKCLGFLDQITLKNIKAKTWLEFTKQTTGLQEITVETIRSKLNNSDPSISSKVLFAIKWLGLLDDMDTNFIDIDTRKTCNLDIFCSLLQSKLSYKPDERDMSFLHHEFIVFNPKTGKRKQIKVNLCEFGIPKGFSAMARTVGLPVAVAALKILKKEIVNVGIKAPLEVEIYAPILKELKKYFDFKIEIDNEIEIAIENEKKIE